MSAHCNDKQYEFQSTGRRAVTGKFDAEQISSDGGATLLREVDRRIGLSARLAACVTDYREPGKVQHTAEDMLLQRIYGICLAYEDLNDHEHLRQDQMMGLLLERVEEMCDPVEPKALASPSTLNRMEMGDPELAADHRYKRIVMIESAIDELMLSIFMESFETPPEELWLDLDATDDPVHGAQEGGYFHGYYDCRCYLPLYIFCGEHLLCSRLRTADKDGADGSVAELERIIGRLCQRWPQVRLTIRADSGFCRDHLLKWCDDRNVAYVIGLARNQRLEKMLSGEMAEAHEEFKRTGESARRFADFSCRTLDSWSCERRVVGKAEYLEWRGANPRFVVTSLSVEEADARQLYEQLYCARGDMENRIKEQMEMFADRTSSKRLRANQLRLYLASLAYILMVGLRRLGTRGTQLARAQCGTLRTKLLKVGVRIKVTTRRMWLSYSQSYPYAEVFGQVLDNLHDLDLWRGS